MNCTNCKYLGAEKINEEWNDKKEIVENIHTGFFACHRIIHGNYNSDSVRQDKKVLAVVVDGSGYSAQLLVRKEFGCNMFEPRQL